MRADLFRGYSADFRRWINWCRSLLMIAKFLVAETIVLVPAYFSHRQDVLDRFAVIGTATISSTFLSHSHASGRDLLLYAGMMSDRSIVRGGAIYRADGSLVGTFGERPSLAVDGKNRRNYRASERRYEIVLSLDKMGLPLTVVGRLDAEELLRALYGPLKRTAAIVLAFVIVLIITGIAIR